MKRLALLLCVLSSVFGGNVFAQLNGDGYYRVRNTTTQRYICVHDDKGSAQQVGGTVQADMGAVEMISDFNVVATDPGSVLYFNTVGSDAYDLHAQGTSTYEIMGGRHLAILPFPDGTYAARVTAKGLAVMLADNLTTGLSIFSTSNPNRFWDIIPINNGDNYFAVQPELEYKGMYYTALYTEFPYELSDGVKAYYVSDFDADNKPVLTELIGKVPAKTAVILECQSNVAANNKLLPTMEDVPAVGQNYLKGVFFNMNKVSGGYRHVNQKPYNAKTMRVLGMGGDKPAFVKSSEAPRAANKAYLELPAGRTFGDEIAIPLFDVTDDPITVTARSYTVKYGDEMPVFGFEVEGGTLVGAPEVFCIADKFSPVGTYEIEIAKGSVANPNVTFVNGTLTIEKAPLTIYVGNYTRKQFEPNPVFTPEYGGFRNGETEDVLTAMPVITTTATPESPVGVYEVIASGAEAENYAISYVQGTLTVEDPDVPQVTITANSYTIKYGDAIPELLYTQDLDADLGGKPVLSCEANSKSPVGTYPIVVSRGDVSYPNVVLQNGTLTIEPAVLNVSVDDYTITQGEQIPAFALKYDGFKNEENESVLTEKPVATTAATSESAPGVYDIVVTGGSAQNYELNRVNGRLTVLSPEPIVVTAKSYTIQYGDDIPMFEYTVEGGELTGIPYFQCDATSKSPVGTYPIVISQGSVSNSNVTFVSGTLTIEKAPLVATTNDYTISQGDMIPSFTVIYRGFRNEENATVLTAQAVATTTATSESVPGVYDITVSGGEAQNYSFVYENAKLTILAADAIIVKVNDCVMTYGDEVPHFEYTVQGGTIEGVPAITCEAASNSPVGEYVINIEPGTVTAANVTFVPGKLTIVKAPLTVSVGVYEREERQDDPPFVLSYEGFKNGEDESVLDEIPTAVSMASFYSPVGEYEIIIMGGKAQNYSFIYVNGKLIINVDSAIEMLSVNGGTFDVYTLAGVKVRSNTTTLKGLPKGIYVVNGVKIAVK